MNSPDERELREQADQVRGRLERLQADLGVVDAEVERLAPQRERHELLDRACGALERLDELGAASLFWGDRFEPKPAAERLRDSRARVRAFQAQLGELDARRGAILAAIGLEEDSLAILGEDLYQIREAEERRKLEWVVERDISALPRRAQRMAWARGGEEDRRFLRSLTASLAGGLAFGALLPMIDLPAPDRFVPADVPRRIAQLVREVQSKPLPPPAVAETPADRTRPDRQEPKREAEPRPSDRPGAPAPEAPAVADAGPAAPGPLAPGAPGTPGPEPEPPKKAGKAGILAFKDEFASLTQDKVAPRLGRQARYGEGEDVSTASSRSMLTTQAPGSSGGINLASLSRSVGRGGGGGGAGALHGGGGGGGGGGGIDGLGIGRATSPIAAIGGGGDDRPLAHGGASASRTDEEIQIVFDRYKASFYRLYNRELRKDPTLRGQMVLRLTIEPDGSVSMCALQASDMQAPDLAAQVVDRVRTINFGPKDGVQALTIVYPIDFLPAA